MKVISRLLLTMLVVRRKLGITEGCRMLFPSLYLKNFIGFSGFP